MHDPLKGFRWETLFKQYDKLCKGFTRDAPYLRGQLSLADSDLMLYDLLTQAVHKERSNSGSISMDTYEGILYWKLYSQPAAVKTVCSRLDQERGLRRRTEAGLRCVDDLLPNQLDKDVTSIIGLVKGLNKCRLFGMASATALPARTTLLHFLFPLQVPIFDKMVLQAVGVNEKNANKSLERLKEYIPFAWDLAQRYSASLARWQNISPLRIIDMALWVVRGGGSRCSN